MKSRFDRKYTRIAQRRIRYKRAIKLWGEVLWREAKKPSFFSLFMGPYNSESLIERLEKK